ncbi:MAG: hypothetical protein ACLUDT_02665 [Blautia massiliensis (ex Durand et al. 2017)]|uniref:hypothetical protein n=1 Tax=Blautia massiliensis (ex Durand et al. 2017) TaxID=1737424 RepID=UPI0039931770
MQLLSDIISEKVEVIVSNKNGGYGAGNNYRLLVNSKLYVIKQWYNASIVTYVLALIMSRISLVEIGLWSLVHKR